MVAGTLCDTLVDGRARSWSGQLSHPLDSAVFWNVRGALACNATLAPTGRQSLTVMVRPTLAQNGQQLYTEKLRHMSSHRLENVSKTKTRPWESFP